MAVAWCGGAPARSLAGPGVRPVREIAVAALARAIGSTRRSVASQVTGAWWHDWTGDPFARGAYSYVRVGGSGAAEALARPVSGTLFFAGEHTDAEGSGTVEGAIASGLRAARQVRRALA